MKTRNPIEADAKLILDMYDYALTHKLDITNKNDVITILEALGQNTVDDERVELLMTTLAVTDRRVRSDVASRKKIN